MHRVEVTAMVLKAHHSSCQVCGVSHAYRVASAGRKRNPGSLKMLEHRKEGMCSVGHLALRK